MTSPDVNAFTDDLFASSQPANSEKVMAVLDSINAKWGRGTLRPGVVPAAPAWSNCGGYPRGSRHRAPAVLLLLEGKGPGCGNGLLIRAVLVPLYAPELAIDDPSPRRYAILPMPWVIWGSGDAETN